MNRPHGSNEGGLLVYRNQKWVGVCDSHFTTTEATIACKSLNQGFNYGVAINVCIYSRIKYAIYMIFISVATVDSMMLLELMLIDVDNWILDL